MALQSTSRAYLRRYFAVAFMAIAAIALLLLGATAFRFLLVGLLTACLVMAAAMWVLHRRTAMRQADLFRDLQNRRELGGR